MRGSDPLPPLDAGHEAEAIEQLNKPKRLPWPRPKESLFSVVCRVPLENPASFLYNADNQAVEPTKQEG